MGDGILLATTDFIGETTDGWQRADFPAPVPVIAGQTYVVSYFAPQGNYAVDQSFFSTDGVVNGPLVLLQSGIDGGNGVYEYNPSSLFPGSSFEASNYWVDPIYISADTDADGDGILNANDNCPVDFNPSQEDADLDGVGDACDTVVGADSDNDGIEDSIDNCPATPNTDQNDADTDGIGDACEPDTDGDGVIDDIDNCPANANPGQEDTDSNGIGDACDFSTDPDNDTLANLNCSTQQIAKFNGSQWICADEAQGPIGPQGETGAAGAVGPQGLAGADSTVAGPTGPIGPQGATGAAGATGAVGPQGSAGVDSTIAGPVGPAGPQGATGAAGATGAVGSQGPAGANSTVAGPAGPPGVDADPAQITALQAQIDALLAASHTHYAIGGTGPGGGIVFSVSNGGVKRPGSRTNRSGEFTMVFKFLRHSQC